MLLCHLCFDLFHLVSFSLHFLSQHPGHFCIIIERARLLAKAVTNQTSATLLRIVGSELIQKYLGDGPKLVREMFCVVASPQTTPTPTPALTPAQGSLHSPLASVRDIEPLHIGYWFLNMHAPPPFRWQHCQVLLYQHLLLLSWLAPGRGFWLEYVYLGDPRAIGGSASSSCNARDPHFKWPAQVAQTLSDSTANIMIAWMDPISRAQRWRQIQRCSMREVQSEPSARSRAVGPAHREGLTKVWRQYTLSLVLVDTTCGRGCEREAWKGQEWPQMRAEQRSAQFSGYPEFEGVYCTGARNIRPLAVS
ncbi:hypothetical protein B0H14DRAFT_2555961 [Mycena olivaceomarginata]|nr:hypothetical protein B0H14DRAFT_2555961 [Mycena olivaceomarginata]